jgi:signal transduction histidine kinase
VQEALTNVRRHSGARRVDVAIHSRGNSIEAEVSDDGRGFDPGALPSGIGTLGMRERAVGLGGRIELDSEPGAGTMVRFVAPLQNLRR